MKVFIGIVASLLCLVILLLLCWGMGWFGVFYKNTIGVQEENANRNIFKENKSYVEGMISDLANYRMQLTTEKDPTAKKAIVDLINSKYANFDTNKIQDYSLKQFLLDVRNGMYNN